MRDRVMLATLGLHPARVRRLLSDWGSAAAVLRAIRIGQIDVAPSVRDRLGVDGDELVRQSGATVLPREKCPAGLGELPDAPDVLFVRGHVPAGPSVAIVGTRAATAYGLEVAQRFGRAVGRAGWPVVSGLARGIDGAAHRGCLEAGGIAVGVLGCGVDVAYPPEHGALMQDVLNGGGAILSEYAAGSPPEPWRFPPRNRIISGLASVVVVVEAGVKGGALITAARALEQGRLVLAVPGDIDRPTSRGCNLLIRDGAHPVLDVDDLLTSLTFAMGDPPAGRTDPPLVSLLEGGDQTIEELAVGLETTYADVLRRVGRLEVAGIARSTDGVVMLR
ncbi:MAG: DNA-protecting protein DprA [Acidimicrobiia bacterium]|nr:DNA-processing protein DprA [Acidimicrobiia bacterium]MBT8217120.1 DNA-processing protein DprA [Acidimicrobiia bacterium]NNF10921.1 DNA-protecting protein DprA [Acidimicrobiia bacterium]NNL71648.1 DNA-protecting protein DprA [Acidimicrobiia bacterium]